MTSPEVWAPEGMRWLNPPASATIDDIGWRLKTRPDTDFWQVTHYGFRRDSGHFLHETCAGDFNAEVDLAMSPNAKYDQAGLMVRLDAENWIKTSVEFEANDGSHLGAVVTQRGVSDWSMRPIDPYPRAQGFRIERRGADFTVLARTDSGGWERIRLTRLGMAEFQEVGVGPYACSPTGAGCEVHVRRWRLEAL